MNTSVYLDHNATAPLRPCAAEAMARALAETGNPSSVHGFGRRARRRVEDAREAVAALADADPAGVVFTAGATEANNLALGLARGRRVLVSAVEHDSVLAAAPEATRIPVDGDGLVDLDALDRLVAEVAGQSAAGPLLVSVMLANNETGAVQPVAEAVARVRAVAPDALLHCDAVQAAGRIPVDMAALGVDMLALSAHKLGGPQGVGALIVRDGVPLVADRRGGGQERGRRAGTEPVAAIAGFGAAAQEAAGESWDDVRALRERLEASAREISPDCRVFAAGAPRLPNTTCLTLPGMSAETQVMALDLAGVAVSAGAACSSGKVALSHVLLAMGVGPDEAATAIRVSLGPATTGAEVDRFLDLWGALVRQARAAA
ncbi:MAG: cysteine desulfurase family protein [Acetobacterales bacterium]